MGNGVQKVSLERQVQIVLVAGMDDPPSLDLAGPHADDRLALTIDREKTWRGFRPNRVIGFDRAAIVEKYLVDDEHPFGGRSDLSDVVEIALDDQGAGHAACQLYIGAAVMMGVIPIGAPRVVVRNGNFDVVTLPRLHRAEDVVGEAIGADMQAMQMEIGGVEVVRQHHIERHRIGVRRQRIDESDPQHVTGSQAERGAGNVSLIGPKRQPIAPHVLVGVGDPQRRSQFPVHRTSDFRLDQEVIPVVRGARNADRSDGMPAHVHRGGASRVVRQLRRSHQGRRKQCSPETCTFEETPA